MVYYNEADRRVPPVVADMSEKLGMSSFRRVDGERLQHPHGLLNLLLERRYSASGFALLRF